MCGWVSVGADVPFPVSVLPYSKVSLTSFVGSAGSCLTWVARLPMTSKV
ncbi:hypothetical protein STANM309S_00197 [Streptomyces tanashiensis]